MAKFQVSKPIEMEVTARSIPGLVIRLLLRRPTWDEADAMRRRQSEQQLSIIALREELFKAKKPATNGNGKKSDEDEDRLDADDLRKIRQLQETFNLKIAEECLNDFVTGFIDKDASGEALFADDQGDVLSENPTRWRPALFAILYRGLADVWRELVNMHSPTDDDVKVATVLQKNSSKGSSN